MAANIEEKAARYYAKGWWTLADLTALAAKGALSEEAVRRITGTGQEADQPEAEPSGDAAYDFAGMSAADVKRSLSYRPTLDEYRQACDWLGLAWDESMTRAELAALIDAAVESGAE